MKYLQAYSLKRNRKLIQLIALVCLICLISVARNRYGYESQYDTYGGRLVSTIISATHYKKSNEVYILIVAERYYDLTFFCRSINTTTAIQHNALALPVIHINRCRWRAFLAQCNVVENINKLEITTSVNESSLIPIRRPSNKRQDVVVCLAPFFLFERWPLLALAVEIWKLNGADLLQTYVMHAMANAMHLLKLYEKSHFVNILPWSPIPNDRYMNPNNELEWRNEPAALTDCLYLHRDNAQYIIFANLDNLLFPVGKESFKSEFDQRLRQSPDASAFIYFNRDVSLLHEAQRYSLKNFNFEKTLQNSMVDICSHQSQTKFVAIPSRILGVWLHNSDLKVNSTFRDVRVTCSDNAFLHLTHWLNANEFNLRKIEKMPLIKSVVEEVGINTLQLQANFNKFIKKIKNASSFDLNEIYMTAIDKCYAKRDFYPMSKYCPGPHLCNIPQNDNPCYVANASYSFIKGFKGQMIAIQQASKIMLQQNGCMK